MFRTYKYSIKTIELSPVFNGYRYAAKLEYFCSIRNGKIQRMKPPFQEAFGHSKQGAADNLRQALEHWISTQG